LHDGGSIASGGHRGVQVYLAPPAVQLQELGGIRLDLVVEVLPPLRPLAVIDDQAADLALLLSRLVPHPVL